VVDRRLTYLAARGSWIAPEFRGGTATMTDAERIIARLMTERLENGGRMLIGVGPDADRRAKQLIYQVMGGGGNLGRLFSRP
jgi:hypothetical protein